MRHSSLLGIIFLFAHEIARKMESWWNWKNGLKKNTNNKMHLQVLIDLSRYHDRK